MTAPWNRDYRRSGGSEGAVSGRIRPSAGPIRRQRPGRLGSTGHTVDGGQEDGKKSPVTGVLLRHARQVQDGWRPFATCGSVANCAHALKGSAVQLVKYPGRPHTFLGLTSCTNANECPVCRVRKTQGEQERFAIANAEMLRRGLRPVMLTLTIRHGPQHDLEALRAGILAALKLFQQSRFYRKLHSLRGTLRRLEVMHGPRNGWHPHVHTGMYFDHELTWVEQLCLQKELRVVWADCVAKAMGEVHRPSDGRGCIVTALSDTDYLCKLGLELLDPAQSKLGREGHRSPWQIQHDAVFHDDPKVRAKSVKLFTEYALAMKGTPMLEPGRELRSRKGVQGVWAWAKEQLDAEADELELPTLTAELPAVVWKQLRELPGGKQGVLDAADAAGLEGVRDYVRRKLGDIAAMRVRGPPTTRSGGPAMPLSSIS